MLKGSKRISTLVQMVIIPMLSLFALWAGAMVYIYLRATQPIFLRMIDNLGLYAIFSPGKEMFSNLELPGWLLYSIPSAIWAFSYSILMTRLWWNHSSLFRIFWLSSVFVVVIGWELLQSAGILPGTYSFIDIIMGLIGASTGMFLSIEIIKYENKKS